MWRLKLLQLSLWLVTVIQPTACQQANATDVCSSGQAAQILSALSQLTSAVSRLEQRSYRTDQAIDRLHSDVEAMKTCKPVSGKI